MAVLTLEQALEDKETLHALKNDPDHFRFRAAVSMIAATKHAPPQNILTEDSQGGFTATGPVPNFIEFLARSMNFTYTLVRPLDNTWGSQLANGTWTGIVGMIARKEADISAANVCRSISRLQVLDYALPTAVSSGKLLAARGVPKIDPWGFFMPLAPMVWLGLILVLLGVCTLLIMLNKKPKRETYIDWAFFNLFILFKAMLNQGINHRFESSWKRVLMGSWVGMLAILAWSYNCNLIALLATRHIDQNIQSLRDLIDHPSMTLMLEKGNIFSNSITRSNSGILKDVNNLENFGRLSFIPNQMIPESIDMLVRRGTHIYLVDEDRAYKSVAKDFSTSGRCDFYVPPVSVFLFACGIIAAKGNPIIPAINYRVGIAESSGLIQHWKKTVMPNSTSCLNAPNKITVQESFSLSSIWGMVAVLLFGLVLATLSFLLELCISIKVFNSQMKEDCPSNNSTEKVL